MAITLLTVANEQAVQPRRERENSFSFSSLYFIDPEGIFEPKGGYQPRIIREPGQLKQDVLDLYHNLTWVMALLINGQTFAERTRGNAIVEITQLVKALERYPKGPIAIDTLDFQRETLPGLVLVGFRLFESQIVNLPIVILDFFPKSESLVPDLLCPFSRIRLRNPEATERSDLVFYQDALSSPIGHLVKDGQFSETSYLLLGYQASKDFRISPRAIEALEGYSQ